MKVYVLTQGRYSDYSIVGIYSSMELAQKAYKLLEAHNYWDGPNDIEEWELDSFSSIIFSLWLRVNYCVTDDTLISTLDNEALSEIEFSNRVTGKTNFIFYIPYEDRFDDKEILKKVARDHYAQWKAQKENIC